MEAAGSLRGFTLSRCEAMGEGAQRVGEGSCFSEEHSLKSEQTSRKSPHPAFGHLLPRYAREKGKKWIVVPRGDGGSHG